MINKRNYKFEIETSWNGCKYLSDKNIYWARIAYKLFNTNMIHLLYTKYSPVFFIYISDIVYGKYPHRIYDNVTLRKRKDNKQAYIPGCNYSLFYCFLLKIEPKYIVPFCNTCMLKNKYLSKYRTNCIYNSMYLYNLEKGEQLYISNKNINRCNVPPVLRMAWIKVCIYSSTII
jgi:hypothetical protein